MEKYSDRKPVNDFLKKITEPPYDLIHGEKDIYFGEIVKIYTESTSDVRVRFLQADIFDIVIVHNTYLKNLNKKNPHDYHRNVVFWTESVIIGLIYVAERYGVRLSESCIKRYEDVDFGVFTLAHILRDCYKSIDTNTGVAFTYADRLNTIQPDTDPANIFNGCIAYIYRIYAQTIREKLKNICKDMGAADVVKCFAVCISEKILMKCPNLAQAHEIQPNINLEKPSTYNEPVKRYIENKIMVKNEADFKLTPFYAQIQGELKPLLDKIHKAQSTAPPTAL